jgi:hypothetical protein
MGTSVSRNEFKVFGCSPRVQFIGDISAPPFPQVLNADFRGNRDELGPLPFGVGVEFRNADTFDIRIQGNNNNNLFFTMRFNPVDGGVIVSTGNTNGILSIEPSGPLGIGVEIPELICDVTSDQLLSTSFITKAIAAQTIPGFIVKGDLYIISVSFVTIFVFISVSISRPKSNVI